MPTPCFAGREKILSFLGKLLGRKRKKPDFPEHADISDLRNRAGDLNFGKNLEHNLQEMLKTAGNSYDISLRRFKLAGDTPGAMIHIDGMTEAKLVQDLLTVLIVDLITIDFASRAGTDLIKKLEEHVIVNEIQEVSNADELFIGMAIGGVGILLEGYSRAILCSVKGWEKRDITEPNAELSIRGPREGFTESLRTNTAMVRRRIRIPQLWIENVRMGDLTHTEVAFAYIKGLTGEKLITEVRSRLSRIQIDGILESGYIEEYIKDNPTIFPLSLRTERSDRACGALLEGRVIIFVDGTPHVLIVPMELPGFMQAVDDYYELFPIGTFVRFLRHASLLVALLLPGFYVATVNFHPELLPTILLLRITAARDGLPLPIIFEVLLMDIMFEILREAGIRLPANIGPAISIVGALILGDAAIRAGVVSPIVVIVIALTAIAGFTAPVFSLGITIRMLRFMFTLIGAVIGLFGIQLLLLILIIHLCSLRSFGIPYMTPLSPMIWQDMKDNLFRLPWYKMRHRPKLLARDEPERQPAGQVPFPGKGSKKPGEED